MNAPFVGVPVPVCQLDIFVKWIESVLCCSLELSFLLSSLYVSLSLLLSISVGSFDFVYSLLVLLSPIHRVVESFAFACPFFFLHTEHIEWQTLSHQLHHIRIQATTKRNCYRIYSGYIQMNRLLLIFKRQGKQLKTSSIFHGIWDIQFFLLFLQ